MWEGNNRGMKMNKCTFKRIRNARSLSVHFIKTFKHTHVWRPMLLPILPDSPALLCVCVCVSYPHQYPLRCLSTCPLAQHLTARSAPWPAVCTLNTQARQRKPWVCSVLRNCGAHPKPESFFPDFSKPHKIPSQRDNDYDTDTVFHVSIFRTLHHAL